MIETRNLIKVFGSKKVLRGIDLVVKKGEFLILLGANGAGKSTLVRIIAGLTRPTSGEVCINGLLLSRHASKVRARLGVVTHQTLLYGDLTAQQNLDFYARMYGLQDRKEWTKQVLKRVELFSRKEDLVRTFSRGMQQRLAIARAILHDPEVILFDEPYTGLDQESCDMLDLLFHELSTRGRTIVMTTHDFSKAEKIADRFAILVGGDIISLVDKTELQGDLANHYLTVTTRPDA